MFRWRAVLAGGALLVLSIAGTAIASSVHYVGKPDGGNPREFVDFQLVGEKCEDGPKHCIDLDKGAKVKKFGAVSWSYPNCPEVLESAFELEKPFRVSKDGEFGGRQATFYSEQVTVEGKINEEKTKAKGTFKVEADGCSTGVRKWTAKPS